MKACRAYFSRLKMARRGVALHQLPAVGSEAVEQRLQPQAGFALAPRPAALAV